MKRQKDLEVRKATILAMVINSLQILMVGVIVLYMYLTPGDVTDLPLARALVASVGTGTAFVTNSTLG